MPVCGTSSVNLTAHIVPDDLPERLALSATDRLCPGVTRSYWRPDHRMSNPSWGVAADVFPAMLSQLIRTIGTSSLSPALFFIA